MTLAFVGVPYIYRKITEKFKPVGQDQDTDDNSTPGLLSDAAFGVVANLSNQSGIFTILSVKFELSLRVDTHNVMKLHYLYTEGS